MSAQDTSLIHTAVREHYAGHARAGSSCCSPSDGAACCDNQLYSIDLLEGLPADVTGFTLGCGNPLDAAALQPGETVLDLGSGGGLDCFLAARQVGPAGRVLGVDMTPEMLARARAAAARLKFAQVEFRQGYLERLPVAANSVDAVISNCVINLAPDKSLVFREIARVLKPGGRVAVSDIVIAGEMPAALRDNPEAWSECLAGAIDWRDYARGLEQAGLVDVRVQPKSGTQPPAHEPYSALITARKAALDTAVIAPAAAEDQPAISELLQANALPTEDLATADVKFFVAKLGGRVVGVAGRQAAGAFGLLRSVAVAPEWRGRGLAAQLVQEVEAEAAARGVRQLYLLTTTAEAYFVERGYTRMERAGAPAEIQATAEFAGLCPDTGVCLTKAL
ncbi:MAG: arsenite methyltransferase [Anaerolineales bacterium]|nr:arsenite methyltransferase [Anaerolineales bacterium]